MATKHDEFKVYYFSFDEDELRVIVESLFAAGCEDLASEILDEIHSEDDDGNVEELASLKIDIDFSAASAAREELDKLTCAVDVLSEAYRGLNEAIKGPVDYSPDATDRLIKEFLAGVRK